MVCIIYWSSIVASTNDSCIPWDCYFVTGGNRNLGVIQFCLIQNLPSLSHIKSKQKLGKDVFDSVEPNKQVFYSILLYIHVKTTQEPKHFLSAIIFCSCLDVMYFPMELVILCNASLNLLAKILIVDKVLDDMFASLQRTSKNAVFILHSAVWPWQSFSARWRSWEVDRWWLWNHKHDA